LWQRLQDSTTPSTLQPGGYSPGSLPPQMGQIARLFSILIVSQLGNFFNAFLLLSV